MELKIDAVFRDLIPPLAALEFEQLEKNIVRDGVVKEPLTTWNGTIIDGHHRWKIIQKHPGIPYTVDERHFDDQWAAIAWACDHQLGRRHSTEEQKAYLRGKLYEAERMSHGGNRGNQHTVASGQNVHLAKSQHGSANGQNVHHQTRKEKRAGTAGRIGKQYGVDGRTIRRDADFAKGLDAANEVSPGLKDAVLTGTVKVPKSTIAALIQLAETEQKEAVEAIQSGELTKAKKIKLSSNAAINEFLAQNGSDCPYDNDDLKLELDCVVRTFRNNFESTLTIHKHMLSDEDAICKVKAALSEAEAAIQELKELLL